MTENFLTACVGVSKTTVSFDKLFNYAIPDEYSDLEVGERVLVAFGKGKKRIGIVLEIKNSSEIEYRELKSISYVIDRTPVIGKEFIELVFWLRDMTLCTYYEAFKTMIPPSMGVKYKEKYILKKSSDEVKNILSPKALNLLISLEEKNSPDEEADIISNALSTDKKSFEELIENNILERCDEVKSRIKDSKAVMICLSDKYMNNPTDFKLTEKQKNVVCVLTENTSASVKELCYLCNVTDRVIKNMLLSGVVYSYEYEMKPKTSTANAYLNVKDIVLSEEQQAAFDGLSQLVDKRKADCALLFGVTGSGKTSVFARLIDKTLSLGRNVIMLIPEISLTPQTVSRFEGLFGSLVSVIHSGLSLTERQNEYKRIKSGESKIVVGTRSAVFAPLDNIGLIVMDEEGEATYKSESSPRYNARDVAKKRCVYHNALLLLASATPSVESYYFAKKGRYKLFTLKKRYSDALLPKVKIIDLGTERLVGKDGIFSLSLANEINENLKRKEQSILLLNRRGYYTFISCPSCRKPLICKSCSIPLTYHKVNNMLICHYCGYSTQMPDKCPECGYHTLKKTGLGTQKLENELGELFPGARVLRMDADTTYSRYSYEKSFSAFENGEYDIMIGTQMIAKGLDFPNVTLVGVLSVDKSLFCGDFKSYEKTFSLITQVVGRSGRGKKEGRAYIQTYVPEHYVINLAAEQNYDEFFRQEMFTRKALIYPPVCDICVVGLSSVSDKDVSEAAEFFKELIKEKTEEEEFSIPLRVLGPSKCVYEKINGKFRYHIIIKCKNSSAFRRFIAEIRQQYFSLGKYRNVSIYIDINGEIGL